MAEIAHGPETAPLHASPHSEAETEEQFHAAVRTGVESAEGGPDHTLLDVVDRIRGVLLAR